jgi:hypothetical protein
MLAQKMDRAKNQFDILKFQSMSKRYDELATSKILKSLNFPLDKFKSTMREDIAVKTLEDVRT